MRIRGTLIGVALVATACAGDASSIDEIAEATTTTTITTSTTSTTTSTTSTTTLPPGPLDGVAAPNGRQYPGVSTDPVDVAERVVELERLLRSTDPLDPSYGDLAHEQQMPTATSGGTPSGC